MTRRYVTFLRGHMEVDVVRWVREKLADWRRAQLPQQEVERRHVYVEQKRQEAFGPIDERTRAEDRQRLADAKGEKGGLV